MKQKDSKKEHEQALFQAITQLETAEECRSFMYDLCTPAEVEEFSDRWRVACLLSENMSYRKIAQKTGVSTTTVGRVAKFLNNGYDGYKTILKRLEKHT